MKKVLLALAIMMSAGTITLAQSNESVLPAADDTAIVAQAVEDNFKEVKLEDLNEAVQTAIKAYDEAYTVKKLENDATTKQTRVTLEDKSTKAEKVVVLGDDGQEVK